LFGPAGMPADVVAKINAEVRKIFSDPEVKQNFLDAQYFDSLAGSPEELRQRLQTEEPKWHRLIEQANIKAE
jgi:tripartite-type tricarboxylate transporter receptor subunit TctC